MFSSVGLVIFKSIRYLYKFIGTVYSLIAIIPHIIYPRV